MATKAEIYAELKSLGVVLSASKLRKTTTPELHALLDAKLAEVASIKRAPSMNRLPKPAAAFRPTAPGSKRALMAELVLRRNGATVEDLMGVTGWNRSTAQGAIAYDLCSQMGMGMRRDGDRYYGSLPEGVTSAVRDPKPAPRMEANKKQRVP